MFKFSSFKITPALKKVLKKHKVSAVYLFGSFATGEATALSDVDIGAVFKDIRAKNKDPSGVFTELYEALREALKIPIEQRLDLVYLQEAPFRLQMNVIKYGIVLYQESEELRTDYEYYVMTRYHDWKFEEEAFNSEVAIEIAAGA